MDQLSQKENDIAKLRERLALLEQQNRALLEGAPSFPKSWRLTAGESRLLAALHATGFADDETLKAAAKVRDNVTDSLVKALVSNIRRKFREAGVPAQIERVFSDGYRLVGELPGVGR
jgi:DNA-binding response OmpR family regulator